MSELVRTPEASITVPIQWRADENPALIYIGHFAPGSRRTMSEALQIVADIVTMATDRQRSMTFVEFPWHMLRHKHVAKIRADLAARYAPSMTKKCLSAVRGVLKQCWRLGLINEEDRARAIDIDKVLGERLPAGRSLAREEVDLLLASTDNSPIGIRDYAVGEFLYSTGSRREEAASARLEKYHRQDRKIVIRGKRNKDREVSVSSSLRNALDAWIAVRGTEPGPIFCHVTKDGKVHPESALGVTSIYAIVMKLAARAGVKNISPHDFRRTFISDSLDAGVDIKTVAQIVGHDDVKTTGMYDRRGERTRQNAVDLLDKSRGR